MDPVSELSPSPVVAVSTCFNMLNLWKKESRMRDKIRNK
jgi:hypothetical protein